VSALPDEPTDRRPRPDLAPDWLAGLVRAIGTVRAEDFGLRHVPAPTPELTPDPAEAELFGRPAAELFGRPAAVLVLFGMGERGPDVLLQRRADNLRSHAGQVSFPGGAVDATDAGPVATALREAAEETGLDPDGVDPLALLPRLFIPPSGFLVTPVLAHWRTPVAVAPVDQAETAAVIRVPVAELADPANRIVVRHPSGWVGPAFEVAGLVVWGFTGGLVDTLLRLGGWARPWRQPTDGPDATAALDGPGARVLELDEVLRVRRPDR
jgi:8-oxo-dGTP pyrophosphatase MutT (NUDIX family)